MTESAATEKTVPSRADPGGLRLPGHIPVLDTIRGIAIILVVLHNQSIAGESRALFARLVWWFNGTGYVGVHLFFVLSGFLITGILVDTRESPNFYRSFFGRRTLRIFPLYYATLLITFGVLPLLGVHVPGASDQLSLWFYVKNWFIGAGHTSEPLPHFWSLCVEEQFYLCWPFVVRALKPRKLIWFAGILAAVSLVARVLVLRGASEEAVDIAYMNTICRMDALTMGAAAAILVRRHAAVQFMTRNALGIAAATLALLGVFAVYTRGYPRTSLHNETFGYTVLAFGFTVLLSLAVLADIGAWRGAALLRNRTLQTFGKYSYGMYVLHMPIHLYVTRPWFEALVKGRESLGTALAYNLFGLGLALVAAMASYHLFEKHFLALKNRFRAA